MINIIKPGKVFREYCFAKCSKCECEFTFEKENIIRECDGNGYFDTYINCPNPHCDAHIVTWEVNKEEVE